MKHPQILLLPVLMFADYFLTVWAAVLKDKGYGKHFKLEHYELNPVWQETIRQKRWVNLRHFLLTLFVSCTLTALLEFGDLPDPGPDFLFGCLFVFFGMILGRHLSNILIFRRYLRYPEEVSGQLVMAHSMVLRTSAIQYLVVVVPVVIIVIFSLTPFTLGGVLGAAMLLAVHCGWIWRHKRASRRQAAANGKQTPQTDTSKPPEAAPPMARL